MKLGQNRISKHIRVKHGGLYSISKPSPEILDFSSNINPLGPPAIVKKTIKKQLKTISYYPDSDSVQMRKNLQWYTNVPYSQIVPGNGATEIIYNFCSAFLLGAPVLISDPTFGEYEAAAKLSGAKVALFKTMNLNHDLDSFIAKIPKNGCVFVCNPNNPTGVLIPQKNMLKIIKAAKVKSSFVFVDECFIELVPDHNESVLRHIKKFDNLFILRSLTKSFGLAGIRVGYGLGAKKITDILNKIRIPWNVSGLAQYAAGAAVCHYFHLDKAKKLIKKESKYLQDSISKIDGFTCNKSVTNFILIRTKQKSKTIQKMLLKKNILIRDCNSFGLGEHYIRIAVKTRSENQKLVKALEDIS